MQVPATPLHTEAAATALERPVLEVYGISKKFADQDVLVDVSLSVRRGQTICILGPSGSGKSTLLRCVNWLERPDHGQIFLRGQRLGYRAGSDQLMSQAELAMIRSRIRMGFQDFNRWPHLTVLRNHIDAPNWVQLRP